MQQALASNWTWLSHTICRDSDGLVGYGGPTQHYWRNCHRTGPTYHWGYDALIDGLLKLGWKKQAKGVADMIHTSWQNPHYQRGSFEYSDLEPLGGTPHEACLSRALLRVGREEDKKIAEANLVGYHMKSLYDLDTGLFRNKGYDPTIVPNKNASIAEAYHTLNPRKGPDYSRIADFIEAMQTRLHGGIRQGTNQSREYTLYTARCLPFLAKMKRKDAVNRAIEFIEGMWRGQPNTPHPIGGFHWGIETGCIHDDPVLVAGAAETLHVLHTLKRDVSTQTDWLLNQQFDNGAFPYAVGDSWLDAVPSPGWNMFVFRHLAYLVRGRVEPPDPDILPPKTVIWCRENYRVDMEPGHTIVRHPLKPSTTYDYSHAETTLPKPFALTYTLKNLKYRFYLHRLKKRNQKK